MNRTTEPDLVMRRGICAACVMLHGDDTPRDIPGDLVRADDVTYALCASHLASVDEVAKLFTDWALLATVIDRTPLPPSTAQILQLHETRLAAAERMLRDETSPSVREYHMGTRAWSLGRICYLRTLGVR